MTGPVLATNGLTKRYPGTIAVDAVDLEIRPHEVLGLIGENGAGKSTLLKILSGSIRPDAGSISVRGRKAHFRTVCDATLAGIGMVYQEQSLIPNITVAENILLGAEQGGVRSGFYRWKALNGLAQRQLDKISSPILPRTKTELLSFADRQMVELAKVLAIEERTSQEPIILLDEPTSVLERAEIDTLFGQIERLRNMASVVFVSHRLEEVLRVADRVYVMRNGKVVAERDPNSCELGEFFKLMVGRELDSSYYHETDQEPYDEARVRLAVRDLSRRGRFRHISFDVHAGEVLALAGVQGSGREDVCRTLFGTDAFDSGTIEIDGAPAAVGSPAECTRSGLAYSPAERRIEGLVAGMSVAENMTLAHLEQVQAGPFLDRRRERALVGTWTDRLRIKSPSITTPIQTLSGGNQQKVVLAKWMISERLRILILDHPTRGLDVGTKSDVYALIRSLAADGYAVVLLADTLEEMISLAHNIVVLKDGSIAATYTAMRGAKPAQIDILEKML